MPTLPRSLRPTHSARQLVGHVGVDAGLVWVGDPCYVVPDDHWDGFVDKVFAGHTDGVAEPNGDLGGLAVMTAHGDGAYPVYVHRDREGRVLRVEIDLS